MRFLLWFHGLFTAFAVALVYFFRDAHAALGLAAGAGLIFFSFLVSVIIWPLVLRKKLIALSVSVIVFKFAILAWILKVVATGKTIHQDWFAVGLGFVVVSSLVTAVRESLRPQEHPKEP